MAVSTAQQLASDKYNEQILVVNRQHLFPQGVWQGMKAATMDEYLEIIRNHQEFHSRGIMENDPTYKQIIPYLIFTHDNKYFLMERHKKASEQRLKSKLTLGIGGHIRKEDMDGATIYDWARREFHEEVHYSGKLKITPVGILNDDSNDVGKVHIGFVFLLEGNSPDIKVKSELADGFLATKEECIALKPRMEGWSQHAFDAL